MNNSNIKIYYKGKVTDGFKLIYANEDGSRKVERYIYNYFEALDAYMKIRDDFNINHKRGFIAFYIVNIDGSLTLKYWHSTD